MKAPFRLAALVAAGLALAVSTPTAVAAPASLAVSAPEPWQPFPEGPLTLPAARYCGGFDLRSTPVQQQVKTRVVTRHASGAVKVQEFTGLLLVDVANLATGETVRRDLSGHAVVTYRENGSMATYEMRGPVGMGWPQQDTYDRGFHVMNGYHVVGFDESGARSMLVDNGTEENLCSVLS